MKNNLSKVKIVILLCVVSLALLVITPSTIAWLKDETDFLVSNFSHGNIKISISESNLDNNLIKNYEIAPNAKFVKDTQVIVEANSEDCYLFIVVDKSSNLDKFMKYEIEDGWTNLKDNSNVYYREVDKKNENQTFNVIKNNVISVKDNLTKEDFNALNEENYPTISISAHAIQRNSKIDAIDTAEDAWLLVSNQNN